MAIELGPEAVEASALGTASLELRDIEDEEDDPRRLSVEGGPTPSVAGTAAAGEGGNKEFAREAYTRMKERLRQRGYLGGEDSEGVVGAEGKPRRKDSSVAERLKSMRQQVFGNAEEDAQVPKGEKFAGAAATTMIRSGTPLEKIGEDEEPAVVVAGRQERTSGAAADGKAGVLVEDHQGPKTSVMHANVSISFSKLELCLGDTVIPVLDINFRIPDVFVNFRSEQILDMDEALKNGAVVSHSSSAGDSSHHHGKKSHSRHSHDSGTSSDAARGSRATADEEQPPQSSTKIFVSSDRGIFLDMNLYNTRVGVWEPLLEPFCLNEFRVEMIDAQIAVQVSSTQKPLNLNLSPTSIKRLMWFIPYFQQELFPPDEVSFADVVRGRALADKLR